MTYRPLHAVKNRHIIAGSFTSPNVNNMMRSASCALLLNLIYSTGFAFHVPLTVQRKSLPKSCSSGVGSVPSNPNCRGRIVLYEAESPDDESEEEAEIVVPPSEDEEEEGGGGEELIAKDLLLTAYRNSKYLYGVATVLTLATVTGPVARTTKIGCATGFAVAARVASILEEATTHDRLQSDTYKCLNVGLHFYNLIGLAAVPAEAALFPNKISVSLALGVFTVVKLFGGYASLNGWKAGVGPGKLLRRELVTGFNDSMKITRTNNRKTSRGRAYRNLVYVLMAGVNIQMVKAFLSVIVSGSNRFQTKRLLSIPHSSLSAAAKGSLH